MNKNPRTPAVAALIDGDKCAFYSVGFAGIQDTLWDSDGRHLFHRCTIQGAVDFIFGNGQSIYKVCHILTLDITMSVFIISRIILVKLFSAITLYFFYVYVYVHTPYSEKAKINYHIIIYLFWSKLSQN